MTPEQVLDALKFLDDAWRHTLRGSEMEKQYGEQILYLLTVQKILAKNVFEFLKDADGNTTTCLIREIKD